MSNLNLEYGNLELMFHPVLTRFLSESDRDTYIAAIRELIDLDAPFVAASGNIRVSPCFLQPTMMIDASCA